MPVQTLDNDDHQYLFDSSDQSSDDYFGSPLSSLSGMRSPQPSVSDGQQLVVSNTWTWHSGFGDNALPANVVIIYQRYGPNRVGEFHTIEMPDTIADEYDHVLPQSQRPGRVSVSSAQETNNHSRHILTFFMIPVQGVATLLTNASTTTTFSPTPNGKILFHFAISCNFIGFLLLLYVLLVGGRLSGSVSRILLGVGYTATSYGFLAAMGMMLQDSIMLWITAVACIFCIPALLSSFLKQRKED